jgi:hypothetical protein
VGPAFNEADMVMMLLGDYLEVVSGRPPHRPHRGPRVNAVLDATPGGVPAAFCVATVIPC